MKRDFSFYEFTGVLLPGATLLLGMIVVFAQWDFVMSDKFTASHLGLFILVGYVTGHLLQAVGNFLERIFYAITGNPTCWVRWKKPPYLSEAQTSKMPKVLEDLLDWPSLDLHKLARRDIDGLRGQLYAKLQSAKRVERLDVFVGNYGLLRGTSAALSLTAIVNGFTKGWLTPIAWALYGLLILSLYRMNRFGWHYAAELFRQALDLRNHKTEKDGA